MFSATVIFMLNRCEKASERMFELLLQKEALKWKVFLQSRATEVTCE